MQKSKKCRKYNVSFCLIPVASLWARSRYLTISNNVKQYIAALKSSLHKARPENKWITRVRAAARHLAGGRRSYELLLLHGFPSFRSCFHSHPSQDIIKVYEENISNSKINYYEINKKLNFKNYIKVAFIQVHIGCVIIISI